MRILVTGAAGFIGFHVAARLLARGDAVTGFDNLNDYYDVALKEARLAELDRIAAETGADWRFLRADLADRAAVAAAFETPFERVIHLAAQAGVRYSLENPLAYVESNVTGFAHLLEACRHGGVGHLVFASTSSVYGANATMPFREDQGVDHPSAIRQLGQGWVAEEALAISVYCALVADDFKHGVMLAVNHDGDSDSTGSITGNLLGVAHGVDVIPAELLDELELREVIEEVADDLCDFPGWEISDYDSEEGGLTDRIWRKYPGN